MAEKEIILFESADKSVSLSVPFENETVWLNRQQMASLFDRDVKTIGKHIGNALEEELDDIENPTVANFATVQTEGSRKVERNVEYYSLDVIISVGYRVKSKRGVEFRKWANSVLKSYILKGYAKNDRRLQELKQTLQILRRTEAKLEADQILSVVEQYTKALDLLDDYDHLCVKKPGGTKETYRITYEECRKVIDSMKFGAESSLFGNEKDDSFEGSIGAIYQTFGGKDVYPTVQEKAANLLYLVTKNHSFLDGNKRIAATMFLYFLDRNGILYDGNGEKRLDDHTLVALTIMIAESRPEEKEMMISVIMNCIS